MTVVLKPRGRGNWATVTLQLTGGRAAPLLAKVGDLVPLWGVVYRVVEVQA